ncbi:hypothetical protein D3C79_1031820 [compost metagenome]
MAGEVGEVTATGNLWIGAPVGAAVAVGVGGWLGQGPAQVPDLANALVLQPLANLLEARQ